MYVKDVFIINDHLGKKIKAMNETILREKLIVSMIFGLTNFTFITLHWDHHAHINIGILFNMGKCDNPS
jgi:hypothetical protein